MDFKYIIIRASSALLLLSGPLFTACDDDDPDAFITVSKQEIEVEYNGLTANGETVNFDLGSNPCVAGDLRRGVDTSDPHGGRPRPYAHLPCDRRKRHGQRPRRLCHIRGRRFAANGRCHPETQNRRPDGLPGQTHRRQIRPAGNGRESLGLYLREQRTGRSTLRDMRLVHSLENLRQSRRRGRRADDRPEYDRRRAYRHIRRGRRFEACDRHRDPEPRGAESFRNVVQGQ